jgi:hypothetical protein
LQEQEKEIDSNLQRLVGVDTSAALAFGSQLGAEKAVLQVDIKDVLFRTTSNITSNPCPRTLAIAPVRANGCRKSPTSKWVKCRMDVTPRTEHNMRAPRRSIRWSKRGRQALSSTPYLLTLVVNLWRQESSA